MIIGKEQELFISNPKTITRKQLQDFGAILNDKRIVQDRNIITSSSPETALDVAFMTLEQLTSKENMLNIKNRIGFKMLNT